jgi:uncharacterized protein
VASPERRCIVTGEGGDRSLLIRFVLAPSGEVVPDLAARLPGRGLWLTAKRGILERAVAKRIFARAARCPVVTSPGLADRVEALLALRIVEAMGLARRAGLAVAGFEKVREAVKSGKSALLFAAIDGAEGGRNKIGALARDVPVVAALTVAEMGVAFGRERVVQAAIGGGPLGARVLCDAMRLAGFRAGAAVIGATPPRKESGIGLK